MTVKKKTLKFSKGAQELLKHLKFIFRPLSFFVPMAILVNETIYIHEIKRGSAEGHEIHFTRLNILQVVSVYLKCKARSLNNFRSQVPVTKNT
jgi:hypothetical protein